jgi:hypothetical protein
MLTAAFGRHVVIAADGPVIRGTGIILFAMRVAPVPVHFVVLLQLFVKLSLVLSI